MNHCPVYQNVGGHSYGWVYPGPIGSILTPMYVGLDKAQELPGGVDVLQPVRRRLPGQDPAAGPAEKAAREGVRAGPASLVRAASALRLWSWVARHPALYGLGAKIGARVLKAMAARDGISAHLPFGTGWTEGRDMPAPAGTNVSRAVSRARWNRRMSTAAADTMENA